jgi:signal transduction histidine kinase
MRRVALLFVLAVFVPSLVLAWLAVRSLRDQQFVLERQHSLLLQGLANRLARDAEAYLQERQREFVTQVESLTADSTPAELSPRFDEALRKAWPFADVGFVVAHNGKLLSPSPWGRPEARNFCVANAAFLGNREPAEVYAYTSRFAANSQALDEKNNPSTLLQQRLNTLTQQPPATNPARQPGEQSDLFQAPTASQAILTKVPTRTVVPQQALQNFSPKEAGEAEPSSKVAAAEAEFRQLIGESSEGSLARFLDNKLKVMFWYRPPRSPQLIFGAQLQLPRLIADLKPVVKVEAPLHEEVCVALLDDAARPLAVSHAHFQPTSWKRPFVATEIGEALPHWEMAVYLLDPNKLSQSARTLTLTISLLVTVLVLAIGVGGWLLVADLRRQLTLARQKTDFVSNVSHELKTPLTSIRMFSELLAEGRVTDPAKQRNYLQVITAEAARLTRLINNVLDFSRLERGEKKYAFLRCDLGAVVSETVEIYRPHLEQAGFKLELDTPPAPVFVNGDRDALAQVLVNLLSNAEKYSSDRKEIRVELHQCAQPLPFLEVRVLDRGLGVPPGTEERIFEQFYRAHDSLSSGIQGSGLGLTLARQIARAHGGEVSHETRAGGGSCFALRLPVAA